MSSTAPRVELDSGLLRWLKGRARNHPGATPSSVARELLAEAKRMEEHPGVFFQDGPTGRRAKLVGGPDVWEVASAVKQARDANPDLDDEEINEVVVETTSVSRAQLEIVRRYWEAHPDEIDERVRANEELGERLYAQWIREQQSRPS